MPDADTDESPLLGVKILIREERMEPYRLEKLHWDDNDFDVMGWHDANVWSLLSDPDQYLFLLDLDYIFKWVKPSENESPFQFWVAPVTMVFEDAHSVIIDIQSPHLTIEVADLHRSDEKSNPNSSATERSYRFECQEGEISLTATGFKMFVRQPPRLGRRQSLSLSERSGVSFERDTF